MKGGSGIGGTHSDLVNDGDCGGNTRYMHALYIEAGGGEWDYKCS